MQDVLFSAVDANPGVRIDESTPQSAREADDTPALAFPDGEAEGGSGSAAAQAIQPQEADGTPTETRPADGTVYYPVYNGQPVAIRADDTERVTALLRQGLRFEQFLPQFEMLRRMSRAAGMHRPEELVEKLQEAAQAEEYRELLEAAGGNEELAAEVMEHRRLAREQKDAPTSKAQPVSTAQRLAEEYGELKRLVPHAPAFSALPDEVVRQAVTEGLPLLQCYLLHEQREQALRDRARQEAQAAAETSTGTLRGLPEEGDSPAGESFRKAFRNRL